MKPGECQLPPYPLRASVKEWFSSCCQRRLASTCPIASWLLSRHPEARCPSAASIHPPAVSASPVSSDSRASPYDPTRALHCVPTVTGRVWICTSPPIAKFPLQGDAGPFVTTALDTASGIIAFQSA